jgi:hypothetical protein
MFVVISEKKYNLKLLLFYANISEITNRLLIMKIICNLTNVSLCTILKEHTNSFMHLNVTKQWGTKGTVLYALSNNLR